MLPKSKWNINYILHEWWPVAFTKGIPENKTVDEIVTAISYQLVKKGYDKEGIIAPKEFVKNYYAAVNFKPHEMSETSYCLHRRDEYKEYYTLTIDELNKLFPIHLTEEALMAIKKSNSSTATKKDTGRNNIWL